MTTKQRIRRTNQSWDKINLNKPPEPELCLYHWSPIQRRNRIMRFGLRPGMTSLDGDWKPPYICLSSDPQFAWQLSGSMRPEIPEWDLWMVFECTIPEYEIIYDTFPDTGRPYPKEYRVYERIFKKNVLYIATRQGEGKVWRE